MSLLRVMLLVATALILAAVLLGYLGGWLYALDGLGYFRVHLLLLAAATGVFAIPLRAWRAAVIASVAAIAALAGLSPLWETAPHGPAGPGSFTLLTANLLYENRETAALRAALNAADADILITNETSMDMLEGEDSLSLRYPYRVTVRTEGRILRTVLWSKFPISETSLLLNDAVEPNAAIGRVRLPDGEEVTIFGVHLDHAIGGGQERQVGAFGPLTEHMSRPLVVAGDFNASPWSYAMRHVQEATGTRMIPGYRISWNGEYPSPLGSIPEPLGHGIDHILLSGRLRASSVRVVDLPGSDHDGILATIEFRGV